MTERKFSIRTERRWVTDPEGGRLRERGMEYKEKGKCLTVKPFKNEIYSGYSLFFTSTNLYSYVPLICHNRGELTVSGRFFPWISLLFQIKRI